MKIENLGSKRSGKSINPLLFSKNKTLKDLLREPEIAGFFRFVERYDLREKAFIAINKKLLELQTH